MVFLSLTILEEVDVWREIKARGCEGESIFY